MNIETANRLYQYRKKMGISQEELAARIGVSRQAVSKWERAEASPDTDNLIELSKVYGVTLDEMLSGGSDEPAAENADSAADNTYAQNAGSPESAGEAQTSDSTDDDGSEGTSASFNINDNGDKVHVGFDGIHVHDRNGTKVDIDRHGIFVNENGEQKVYTDSDGVIHKSDDIIAAEQHKKNNVWMKLPYPIVAVAAYILFGTLNVMGGWAWGWIVFLTIPLYYTLVEAIIKRRASIFCYPVLAVMVFLILGASMGVWHPAWVIFLTIPIYYWITSSIEKK